MAVTLTGKKEGSVMTTAATWEAVLNSGLLIQELGERAAKTGFEGSERNADNCALLVDAFKPEPGFWSPGNEQEGKGILVDFFKKSGGFSVYISQG